MDLQLELVLKRISEHIVDWIIKGVQLTFNMVDIVDSSVVVKDLFPTYRKLVPDTVSETLWLCQTEKNTKCKN